MTPAPPRMRYRVVLKGPGDTDGPTVLVDGESVVAWVSGFGAALGDLEALDAIAPSAPEDTRRIQAMQIGHARGWFKYLYPETATPEG